MCMIYSSLSPHTYIHIYEPPRWSSDKEPTWQHRRHKRCQFNPRVEKILWRRKRQLTQLTPVYININININICFPGDSDGKESAGNAGDPGLIPGLGRSPGEGYGNPLQYSCLENPMDRGAWWDTVHGVAESDTTEKLTLTSYTPRTRHLNSIQTIVSTE